MVSTSTFGCDIDFGFDVGCDNAFGFDAYIDFDFNFDSENRRYFSVSCSILIPIPIPISFLIVATTWSAYFLATTINTVVGVLVLLLQQSPLFHVLVTKL